MSASLANETGKSNFSDWITNDAAARVVGCADNTMRKSRSTGMLYGRPAPAYIKRGYHVFYRMPTLIEFNKQFREQQNTTQTQQVIREQAV